MGAERSELRELVEPIARITGLAVAGAVAYGVVHDQVTARICPEYFTMGHADVGLRDPTLLGLYWGIAATWWVGVGLGLPAGALARIGAWPKVEPREVLRPLLVALPCVAAAATVAGVHAASSAVPEDLRWWLGDAARGFWIDLRIHQASYASGAAAGLVI